MKEGRKGNKETIEEEKKEGRKEGRVLNLRKLFPLWRPFCVS